MATYPSILKYSPFSSLVEPSFWHKLAQLKLDVDRLDETERKIWGMYHMTPVPNRVSRFILDCTAFNSDFNQPLNTMGAYGALLNKNTIESFKSTDKMALLKEHGMKMVESIKSGEALMNPALLTRFLLLTFSDLKKYRFYHWFAFPAFSVPNANINIVSPPKKLTDVFTKHQLQALYEKYFTIPEWTQKVAFICEVNELTTKCYSLTEVKTLFSKSNNAKVNEIYLVISDPSTLPQNPGWTPRNILHMLAYHCPDICQQHIRVICLRLSCQTQDASSDQSLLFEVVLPYVNLNDDEFVESLQWVGWERHPNGKMVPRTTDLSEEMDPSRLAESSVDLNLKLMKWRLAPKLDLDIIKNTSCLLLGSGTLGCAVARTLLGWGVRTITLVDNGRVSYSNPVRQSLFIHTDCINGGRPKAEAAADALRAIFPGVKARGVQLTIPMPGHVVGESMYAEAARRVEILEKLVEDHDVVFLLMDSRESRWLPTLLAAIHKKITICSALGFDTYLIMRHGVLPKMDSDVDNDSAGTTSEKSSNLGCYFCNDVTAPGNSQVDRTLDQQCTVTRPGLSFVAAGLAVELMVSLLQHPLKAQAPPACESDAESGPLSIVPHSIRGFLSQFTQILPASPRFGNCIACSEQVLNEYSEHGFKFLLKVFNDPKYLEDVAGLTELHEQTEEAEILMWSDDSEIE
ncbi:hypothetical protein R5R35_011274 [Gryllus longicercus]